MLLLLGFAFLSGLVTILAPCVWPLLPIVLSSSLGQGHRRPLGITLGVMASFAVFTLTISSLVSVLHFDPNIFRLVAVVIIASLGLMMVVPKLSRIFEFAVSRLSGRFGKSGQAGSGFGAGLLTGISLGIVWAPCAGPILAAITTLAAMRHVSFAVVAITAAYITGIGIPLFIFAYGGQRLLSTSRSISPYTGRIQQIFGVIMLLTAVAIYTNYDKVLEAGLLNRFPGISGSVNQFENNEAVRNQLDILKGNKPAPNPMVDNLTRPDLFNSVTPAPELAGINHWLNTAEPLTLASLRGKVVLIDFWTYTCINCIRTLPHVTSWYDKYKDKGFVVIGVHTPEFEFEKQTNNVSGAISQYKIHYPVAQDNDYGTWGAFNNQYWPAEYLIDAEGVIRRAHFGEGEYDKTEEAIQVLLTEAGQSVTSSLTNMPDETPRGARLSPETYLGSQRAEYYFPEGGISNGTKNFTLNDSLPNNSVSLGGSWTIGDTQATAGDKATLNYHFTANKVFLVLRPGQSQGGKIKVFLDGKLVDGTNAGADVKGGVVTVDKDRLYNLIDLHGKSGSHILRLEFEQGIEAFAFTFG